MELNSKVIPVEEEQVNKIHKKISISTKLTNNLIVRVFSYVFFLEESRLRFRVLKKDAYKIASDTRFFRMHVYEASSLNWLKQSNMLCGKWIMKDASITSLETDYHHLEILDL